MLWGTGQGGAVPLPPLSPAKPAWSVQEPLWSLPHHHGSQTKGEGCAADRGGQEDIITLSRDLKEVLGCSHSILN